MAITRATNLAAVGSGLGTSPAQPINVGTGVTIDGNSGIITANSFSGSGANLTGIAVTDDVSTNGLVVLGISTLAGATLSGVTTFQDHVHLGDNDKLKLGDSEIFEIFTTGTNSIIKENGSGNLKILGTSIIFKNNTDSKVYAFFYNNGSASLYYDGSKKFETTGLGVTVFGKTQTQTLNVSGVSTFTGVGFTGFLREGINIVSGKLSDNTTINIDHGMAHYFTTTETTTGIPNFTSTAGINTDLSVGETFSVNVITTAATAGYSTGAKIDAGATLPVLWNGGDDPSEGGSGGVDAYTYQIIKTGDAAFTILGNVSNFA
jgi:hypothetical protein